MTEAQKEEMKKIEQAVVSTFKKMKSKIEIPYKKIPEHMRDPEISWDIRLTYRKPKGKKEYTSVIAGGDLFYSGHGKLGITDLRDFLSETLRYNVFRQGFIPIEVTLNAEFECRDGELYYIQDLEPLKPPWKYGHLKPKLGYDDFDDY